MHKSTRDKGNSLEDFVLASFSKFDRTLHRTKNSGANIEKGDLVGKFWKIECKQRNTKDVSIKKKIWDKICSEIRVGTNQIPMYILENQSRQKFVVMELGDFQREMEKIYGTNSWEEK